MIFTFDTSASATAGVAASEIALEMTAQRRYRLAATAAAGLWFRVVKAGATGAAVAGAGSHYLAAGEDVPIAAIGDRNKISVIREAGTDAVACLSELPNVAS